MMTTSPSENIREKQTTFVRSIVIGALTLLTSLLSFAAVATPQSDATSNSHQALSGDGERRYRPGNVYSVRDLYRTWGKTHGIQVIFDPKLKDQGLDIELPSSSAEESLAVLTKAAGHFATSLDAKTVVIADDTPQNRRQYEPQALQTIPLENIDVKDAMVLLRSLFGLKHIAAQDNLNSLTLRDTTDKIALAEQLIRVIDKPQAETVIDVELLYLDGKSRARLAQNDGLAQRLSAQQLAELRRVSRAVSSHQLSVIEGKKAEWSLRDDVLIGNAGDDSASSLTVGFKLEIRPQVHDGSQEVSLDVSLEVHDATLGRTSKDPSERSQEVNASTRVANGETFLLSGFLPLDTSLLLSRLGLPNEHSAELVMVLTPNLVRGRGYSASDLEAFAIGTEAHPQKMPGS